MNLPKQFPSVQRKLNRFAGVEMSAGFNPASFLKIIKAAAVGALHGAANAI